MAGEQQHDLVNIVRECVRNEIELQRSGREGNANLWHGRGTLLRVLQDQPAGMLRIHYLLRLALAVPVVHSLFFQVVLELLLVFRVVILLAAQQLQ